MSMHSSKSTGRLGGTPLSSHQQPSPSLRSSTTSLSMASSNNRGGGSANNPVENSIFTFPTPQKSNVKRSGGGQQQRRQQQGPPTRKAKNIQREYQLLQSQTILLVCTASLGFILFLLFTLPIGALIGLTVMVTSLGACLLLASSAIKTKYQLEMQHPLGLVRYLPETIRAHLTEKSLHECLSPSASMESFGSISQQNNHSSKDSLSSCSSQNNNLRTRARGQQQQRRWYWIEICDKQQQ